MIDDILAGVRKAREEFSVAHDGNLWAMAAELRRLDEIGDWPVVCLSPRRPESDRSTDGAELPVGCGTSHTNSLFPMPAAR